MTATVESEEIYYDDKGREEVLEAAKLRLLVTYSNEFRGLPECFHVVYYVLSDESIGFNNAFNPPKETFRMKVALVVEEC